MAASLPIWKERKEGGKGVMRQIDAVLLDIDGTLVPAGRYGVSAPVVKRVDEIRRQGVKVIVATGRSGFVMGPRLLGAFEADYYICSNGGEVLNAEKQRIYERRFTAEQVERLTAHCDAGGLSLFFAFADGYGVYTGYEAYRQREEQALGQGRQPDQSYQGWIEDCPTRDRHQAGLPFGGVLYGEPEPAFYEGLEDLQFVPFCPGGRDIYRREVDKAQTAGWLLEQLGIAFSHTAAIGDGNNDLPLLAAAGIGVAMGNARPTLKKAADFVVGPSEEDGLLEAFDWLKI